MKFSATFTSSALILVGAALVLVEASGYDQYSSYAPQHGNLAAGYRAGTGAGSRALAGYNGGCRGYNCHYSSPRGNSAYGPYHSYAVRPAIYGGHGLYNYRGYARHNPPPPLTYHRAQRACDGYNCRNKASYSAPQRLHYGLRPVKALVLAPASYNAKPSYGRNYNSNTGHYASRYRNSYGSNSGSNYNNNNYYSSSSSSNNNRGYRNQYASAASLYGAPAYRGPASGRYNRNTQHSHYGRGANSVAAGAY